MRAASLDRRVRSEARELVREARAALARQPALRDTPELDLAASEPERALAAGDRRRLRRALVTLDAMVDERVEHGPRSLVREVGELIVTAVVIALFLRAFVVEAFTIPSSSMYPTLEINDRIVVNKFAYGIRIPWTEIKLFARSPQRGEVIVFDQPCQ